MKNLLLMIICGFNCFSISHANLFAAEYSTVSYNYIESQIDGDFNGWEGETVYKLTNGQVWQQAEYTYTYSYSFMPKIIIFMKNGSYYMQVKNTRPVRVNLIG
jgi:hypothetical protein